MALRVVWNNNSSPTAVKNTGFTLVEVLVATTIGTFIALVAVGALKAITTSAELLNQNINAAAEVRFAARVIARDLINLYRDRNKENTEFIGTAEQSGQVSNSYLLFYTVSRAKARVDQPETDVYEVEYYLLKDEKKSVLCRRLWPNPDKENEPGGILTVIAEDIDVFQVRYFDGEEWFDEWPEEMQTLPLMVEVNIVSKQLRPGTAATESFMVNFARLTSEASATLTEGSGAGEISR